ncbi:EamA family transporter [Caulobacter sp. SLTY]|nr:EamA family transporter [Caulobacter sp. SLTY]
MFVNSRALPLIALLAGACAIGFAPIFVRLTETGPAAAGFWRMFLALPLLAPFLFRPGKPAPLKPNLPILLAGLFFAGDLALWHYGIGMTSVANATVLANLTPLVVTVAGFLIFREKVGALFLVGMGLGLIGAWTMAEGRGAGAPGSNPPLGDALSAATALFYAGYFFCVRQARATFGTTAVMFWSSLVTAAALGVIMLLLGEPVLPASLAGWGACLGLAVVHVTGQGAIAWALGRLPTPTASVVVLIQPAVAAALGWMIFAEIMTPLQGFGALLALAGVAIAQWASARDQAKADQSSVQ